MKRGLVVAIIMLVLGLATAGVLHILKPAESEVAAAAPFHGVREFMGKATMEELDQASGIMTVISAEVVAVRDRKVGGVFRTSVDKEIQLSLPRVCLSKDGSKVFCATAKNGRYERKSKRLELENEVVIELDGSTIAAQRLLYLAGAEIEIPERYEVTGNGGSKKETRNNFRGSAWELISSHKVR